LNCARILEQFIRARNLEGMVLLYRPTRAGIFKKSMGV
jgi:hypothetical protein